MMSYILCTLPKEQQEKVEVEKAAVYAVWKERNPEIKIPAKSETGNYKGGDADLLFAAGRAVSEGEERCV